MRLLHLFLLVICFSAELSFADELGRCHKTPDIWELFSLPKSYQSNDLTRREGAAEFAKGKFIKIKGKVFDSNCVPVSGATIRIWQANANGIYQFLVGNEKLMDKNFTGSGTAITDNLGEYVFYSVYPGAVKNEAPSIIFQVEREGFSKLETRMFFPGEKNQKDKLLTNSVAKDLRKFLIAQKVGKELEYEVYRFNVTLKGYNIYKEY